MSILTSLVTSRYLVWLILALPAAGMLSGYLSGASDAEGMLHPTGEFAARFMIIAMLATPLMLMFPGARIPKWLVKNRRYFGVAAFGYALLHTIFYIVDMGSLQAITAEMWALGIWTGWLAFFIFVPLAITSNNLSQRILLAWWKRLQRLAYIAAVLTLVHWIFIHNNYGPALVHFLPLAGLELYRIWKTKTIGRQQKPQTAA